MLPNPVSVGIAGVDAVSDSASSGIENAYATGGVMGVIDYVNTRLSSPETNRANRRRAVMVLYGKALAGDRAALAKLEELLLTSNLYTDPRVQLFDALQAYYQQRPSPPPSAAVAARLAQAGFPVTSTAPRTTVPVFGVPGSAGSGGSGILVIAAVLALVFFVGEG